jgi:tetratricopeptide (TPR) repeat protein
MDTQPEIVREKFDVDQHLIDKVWENAGKGLRKEVIDFRYCSVVKASELSKCLIEVLEVNNLDPEKHTSNYLENIEKELWVEIGYGVTAIDCYVEEFLKQMFTNETSKCSITTKSSGVVEFTIRLKRIEFGGYYCEQTASRMFELAKLYKENGVKMFKEYTLFAHNYFNLAAKCLLSFNPFDDIDDLTDSTIKKSDFEELLQNIYLNIAACLVKEQRYEDIIHVLNYSIAQDSPSDKAVYRLALAYFHLKQFENAKNTIERINYKSSKDLVQLMGKIYECWKVDHNKYSNMVKKMFA